MNSESFAEYLAQPAKLYQLPYQEIKNLVEEYPYAGNLRLMLFIKSKIEQDASFEAHLHQLAAHTFDRQHLFDLNHQQLKEMLDLATGYEDRLELQDLSELEEKELANTAISTEQEAPPLLATELAIPIAVSNDTVEDWKQDDALKTPETTAYDDDISPTEPVADLEIATPDEVVETVIKPAEVTPATEHQSTYQLSSALLDTIVSFPLLYVDSPPQPKAFFASWKQYRPIGREAKIERLYRKARQSISGFEQPTARQVAAKSVTQKPGVATETLAKLLEKQGSYGKAIKMYEQLSLLNPEKSRYFAAIIEKLKQNI